MWTLRDLKFSLKKTYIDPSLTGRQGLTESWTFIWAFVRKACELRVAAFHYLVSVCIGSTFLAINNITLYWPHAVRSSNVCAKLFVGVPWGTRNRLHQNRKREKKVFLPTETPGHSLLTFLKGCGRWGHVFEKVAMSPCSTVHGGQYDTKNKGHSSSYCMRHWLTHFGAFSLT